MHTKGFLAGIVCLAAASFAGADEISELKQQVQTLQDKIANIETVQSNQAATIAANAEKEDEGSDWEDKISFYGDFRLRYDSMNAEKDNYVRERGRFRARVGMKAEVNEEVTFDLRLATGGDSATSGNSTFEDYGNKKDFMIDRAYVTYKPAFTEGLAIKGGKFGIPFYCPNKSQMIWDGDLNLEGAAASYEVGPVFINAASFIVDEQKTTNDAMFYGAQVGTKFDIASTKNTVGVGSHNYSDVDMNSENISLNIVEVFADTSFKVMETPVMVYGNFAQNCEADSDDTGYLVGVKLGKAKKPGTWQIGYEYMDIEEYAVYDPFNDSDALDGATGVSHKFTFDLALMENAGFGLTYLMGDFDDDLGYGDNNGFSRVMADLKYKF